MTDADVMAQILQIIEHHGLKGVRALKDMIQPPGGQKTIRRCTNLLTDDGKLYPRTRYGNEVFGLEPPAPRPQNKAGRPVRVNQHDEPPGKVIVKEISPGHRLVKFGKDWRPVKALTAKNTGGLQCGMNSIYMGA